MKNFFHDLTAAEKGRLLASNAFRKETLIAYESEIRRPRPITVIAAAGLLHKDWKPWVFRDNR